jgi:hypothetical protein
MRGRLVFAALVLAVTGAGLWFWIDDSRPDAAQAGDAAADTAPEAAKRPISVRSSDSAAPAPVGRVSAAASDAPARTASPQPDPFKGFLDASKANAAAAQSAHDHQPLPGNPFEAALQESQKRAKAASASPFGAPR